MIDRIRPKLRVLDLFSGIGGFALGLERAGMKTIAFCEIDPFCQRVLRKHWPDIPIYKNVKKLTIKKLEQDDLLPVDMICGGFPCQDISFAGKGAGIEGKRSGLWSEYARIIGEVRPRYVIVENVAALLIRGLDRVLGDLAALGYDAEWHCIPASAIGAPHRRDRIWIVAYPASERCGETGSDSERYSERLTSGSDVLAYADSAGLSKWKTLSGRLAEEIGRFAGLATQRCDCTVSDTDSEPQERPAKPWCERHPWTVEPDVGRVVDGISGRVDRIRSLGNAVVPQIVEIIGKAILRLD